MNLPFDLGFPPAGTLRERLRLAHKARALSEVETRQRGNSDIFFSRNLLSK